MKGSLNMLGAVIWALGRIFRIACPALIVVALTVAPSLANTKYLTLCLHDIPRVPDGDMDISEAAMVNQFEFLKVNGYSIISPDDIWAAQKGIKPLPPKAVLLTFDDGYATFYDFVFPVLKLYGYPAVISIVTSWTEKQQSPYKTKKMMSWKQVREVEKSPLVYVGSHSYDMHKGAPSNPVGNIEPLGITFQYIKSEKRYETESEFRNRVRKDLAQSIADFKRNIGKNPKILTWPYGEYNELGVEEAAKLGFEMILTLDPFVSDAKDLLHTNRILLYRTMEIEDFAWGMPRNFESMVRPANSRAIQLDLDLIIKPASWEESDENLGLLIDRLVESAVNTVIIQAFDDRDGDGNIHSMYYANDVLPVSLDFLNHVVNRIRAQGILVFIWMPVLGYELPDKQLNASLKVLEAGESGIGPTKSWYRRLTPFDPRSLEVVKQLYRNLAQRVFVDGILFQDDAYLSENEDFHPAALKAFKNRYGMDLKPDMLDNEDIRGKFLRLKTEKLDEFTLELKKVVLRYRPMAEFARNIYAEAVFNPEAENWFSQNFDNYLKHYDFSIIMAYPQMDKIYHWGEITDWFDKMLSAVDKKKAFDKVFFKIQSYDWDTEEWIDSALLKKEMRYLVARGAKHIAYYPDNVYENQPDHKAIASAINTRILPPAAKLLKKRTIPAAPKKVIENSKGVDLTGISNY